MCLRAPKPPPLPKPEPRDSAIEDTADRVVVADNRKSRPNRRKRLRFLPGGRTRLGTRSLQIPLLGGGGTAIASGNLTYPSLNKPS